MYTAKELHNKMMGFSRDYFLVDARRDKNDFFAVSPLEMSQNILCCSGQFLNYVMDGQLEKAWEVIEMLPKTSLLRIGLTIVHPQVTWKQFIKSIEYLRKTNQPLNSVVLTAARPYLLNGFNDFTRLGPLLERKKDTFIECSKYLYGPQIASHIYKLCLAEYYYQTGKVLDAEVQVSQAIIGFDQKSESRLLFAALYLQSKILLTQGRTVNAESYIEDIRAFVKESGNAECSYNINAAEVLCAMYEGNYTLISSWMKNHAPDEFGDFNMLDLYRYMIKLRCYIIEKKYSSVVALAEKLRPLIIAGKRHMDLCELDLLLAMSFYSAQKKDLAVQALERALKIAKRRNYCRLVADEGELMLQVLIEYVEKNGTNPFVDKIIDLTRSMAVQHPLYLMGQYHSNKKFSQMEIDILKFLEHGKSKEEIARYFFISVNTVKYHMKNIYSKLGVHTPHQAVWNGKLLGII